MTWQSRVLRITTFPIASLLLIMAFATLHPVCADTARAYSDSERRFLEQVENDNDRGYVRILEAVIPDRQIRNKLQLSASFIANILTGRDPRLTVHRKRIVIRDAVISGELDIRGQDIPYDVLLINCTFDNPVDLSGSHFARGVVIMDCDFEDSVDFTGATLTEAFFIHRCAFQQGEAVFSRMQIDGGVIISSSAFNNMTTYFGSMRVGRAFTLNDSTFHSRSVSFADLRVEGPFSIQGCTFFDMHRGPNSRVNFTGAHASDFVLNDSHFDNISTIDFTRLQADLISFDGVQSTTASKITFHRMTFRLLRPVNAEQLLKFLLSNYDPELYTDVETSLRTHGYPDEADKIFIAKKRAERRENCKSFLHQCARPAWALSLFEDLLAGYGKSLQNLLYWSLGFLIIGMIVFRSETGMRTKDEKDAENYQGKYNAFWYSLDLFLPVIKLGEADVWTPKQYRRWANLYRRVHIIIGSLFVPIGLAAWTGIIK